MAEGGKSQGAPPLCMKPCPLVPPTPHPYPPSHCRVDYNLEAAESDKLLLSLLEVRDDNDMDEENTGFRKSNRHSSLFGLYPLPDRRNAPENRTPSLPPSEHQGLRLLIKVSELR